MPFNFFGKSAPPSDPSALLGLPLTTSKGESKTLGDVVGGKVSVLVNTASQCGFTKHYEGLQALQDKYAARGFTVLAFPCNQFGGQEPGTDAEIEQFVCTKFKGTFPLSKKVDVNGANADPIFQVLKTEKKGFITDDIKWNFTKFLLDKEGNVVKRFAPTVDPKTIEADVEKLLASE